MSDQKKLVYTFGNIRVYRTFVKGSPPTYVCGNPYVWEIFEGNVKVDTANCSRSAWQKAARLAPSASDSSKPPKESYEEWKRARDAERARMYGEPHRPPPPPPPPPVVEEKQVSPYDLLGVSSGASDKSIKKAWRKLLISCHPDKLQHKGESFRAKAEKLSKAVNEAYQQIMEWRKK